MEPIASVIKYEGDDCTFIWKHPCEDFNISSQLIVHESQEAIKTGRLIYVPANLVLKVHAMAHALAWNC